MGCIKEVQSSIQNYWRQELDKDYDLHSVTQGSFLPRQRLRSPGPGMIIETRAEDNTKFQNQQLCQDQNLPISWLWQVQLLCRSALMRLKRNYY